MEPASRTPEGRPNECPVCGKRVCIEPSLFPTQDAPCPNCGHLLWFSSSEPSSPNLAEAVAEQLDSSFHSDCEYAEPEELFGVFERVMWSALAITSTSIVWLNDQQLSLTVFWFLGVTVFS